MEHTDRNAQHVVRHVVEGADRKVPERPQVVVLEQPLPQLGELFDKHPVTHRQQRRHAAGPDKLETTLEKRRVEVGLALFVRCLNVGRVGHFRCALIRRVTNDDVILPLADQPHKPDPCGELLAAQAQAEVVAVGVCL